MKAIIPPYVIDTREKEPYSFDHQHIRAALKTGDYSVQGLESDTAVERKKHNEFIQMMTHERERFEKELARSNDLRKLHVVVEASLVGVLDGLYDDFPNQTHPNAIRGTLVAWSNRFPKVQFWFCNDREHGQAIAETILRRAWIDKQEMKVSNDNASK